ncbi:MAG: murein hydrolase activator EnvC family protein [Saprospiraceae bacterium]
MRNFSLIFFLFCFCCLAHGQSYSLERKQLEDEKKRLLDEISKNEMELSKTDSQKKDVLFNLSRIEQNILQRKLLLASIQKEKQLIENQMVQQSDEQKKLESQKQKLQKEYSSTLRWVYRNKINNSMLHFIISAETFNNAFKRLQLLRQYNRYRSQHAEALKNTLTEISKKITSLESLQSEKNLLIKNLQSQEKNLSNELKEKTKLLAGLESAEKILLQTIAFQEAQKANLQSAIQSTIQKEIEIAKRNSYTPETSNNTNGFAQRKGSLDWPVSGGKVIQAFGKRPHPTLKKILIQNNGINISTHSDASVNAVHPGVVVGVTEVPGYNFSIILKHENDYFTVYTNLTVVSVVKGEKVGLHQKIGRVPSENPEFHFEIWNLKEHLNPLDWLQNKSTI